MATVIFACYIFKDKIKSRGKLRASEYTTCEIVVDEKKQTNQATRGPCFLPATEKTF
jgi:hypothetical protein